MTGKSVGRKVTNVTLGRNDGQSGSKDSLLTCRLRSCSASPSPKPVSGTIPLCQSTLTGKFQSFDGCTAGPGGVAVGHHVDRNIRLLLALRRASGADFIGKPALELLAGLMAPPPTMKASGSKVFTISSKKSPSAWACTRKISTHMGSPFSARPRTSFGRLVKVVVCPGRDRDNVPENTAETTFRWR